MVLKETVYVAVALALMPLMALRPVAAVARRSPIRLFDMVSVEPDVTLIPFTVVPAWLPERS